jgi:hypothetical protein
MIASNLRLRLAFIVSIAATAAASAYGCSSGDNNGAGPSTHDGGSDGTTSSSGGSDSGSSSGGDATGSSSGDSAIIDTGSCKSDASTCNSCYTSSQAAADPLNACAKETANCVPFTKTVPSHPTL